MDFTLLPAQYSLLKSDVPIAAMIGGIGAGKSFTLAHFVIQQVSLYPNSNGLICANTYTQLQNATIPALTALCDDLGLKYKLVLGGAKKHITIQNTKIFIYSAEVEENIRGIEVGWACVDEVAFSSKEFLDVLFGRIRQKNSSLKARFFTSPNGFNFFYDFINKNHVELHKCKTSDNKNLPASYYESLVSMYGGLDSPLAKQELLGEFVNLTSNSVYHAFKRAEHVIDFTENTNLPLYIGCDFNVQNMNYVVIQWSPDSGFKVLESIQLKDQLANTFTMAEQIFSKYGHRAIVIPDSTGKSRKTSAEAGITDIRILQNVGLKVLETLNPRIKDRQNTVNLQFHKKRIQIDPKCTELITELETLASNQDEGSNSHLAVAMGYVIWKLEPLQNQKQRPITQSPFLGR